MKFVINKGSQSQISRMLGDKIGFGSYGSIYLKFPNVIKVMDYCEEAIAEGRVYKFIENQKPQNRQYFTRSFGCTYNIKTRHVCLELEKMTGDVYSLKFKDDGSQIKKNILRLVYALKILHDQDLSHGDLKTQNILVKNNLLYLSDLSCVHVSHWKDIFSSPRCTVWYRDPILFENNRNINTDIFKADIWSLGCVIYELITHKVLFKMEREADILTFLQRNYKPWLSNVTNDDAKLLLDSIFTTNMTILQVIKHPYFEDHLKKYMLQKIPNNNLKYIGQRIDVDVIEL